ncbi:response regulator transcription factor [Gorillibacterium massiliense]|uniref:response regulator transcription factor n=1 Tax=Gorillibacterium massiliense TaxID=1280390 RepID=UPI0004B8B697|nr:response regulator [Gorillibacterium massiliense]
MLKALIVDDEYEIREGLRKRIRWDEYGISEVLVAADGDEALQIALENRPDLILTDIKMNRMTGLEFLEELASEGDYSWKAVLISGYDDFSLVKQAIQLGAIDYILKPINTEELGRIIRKAIDMIEKENLDRKNKAHMLSQVQFAVPKLREELLREMIENDYDPYRESRISHRLRSLKLEWMEVNPAIMMIVEVDDLKAVAGGNGFPDEKELILFGIGNVVSQTLAEEMLTPTVLFRDSSDRWVAVFSCPEHQVIDQAVTVGEICLARINQFVKIKACIGLSSTPREVNHLRQSYLECGEWLEQKILYGGNRLFTEAMDAGEKEHGELSIREPHAVLDLLKYGSDEEISEAMNGFEDMVKSWEQCYLKDIQQLIFKWLMDVFRAAAAAGWSDRTWERDPIAIWEKLEQYDHLESLKEQAEIWLLAMAANFRQMPSSTNQIVQEAEKIIRSRYAENLSLQLVADEVHVTPVWLSKLFKKEKGKTFLEVLTDTRICKAKGMLGDVKYKIYQISYQVGYKDPVHFTKLFKKQMGVTPKEFRRQRGILDD